MGLILQKSAADQAVPKNGRRLMMDRRPPVQRTGRRREGGGLLPITARKTASRRAFLRHQTGRTAIKWNARLLAAPLCRGTAISRGRGAARRSKPGMRPDRDEPVSRPGGAPAGRWRQRQGAAVPGLTPKRGSVRLRPARRADEPAPLTPEAQTKNSQNPYNYPQI